MTFERAPGPAAEPAPVPVHGPASDGGGPSPVQIRLQILSTEHWSLLASRSLAWSESFTRAGMFLSTLSASIVALSLIAGIAGFGDAFFVFALVILPIVLFVGIGTLLRLGAANYHEAVCVLGMNRIRAAYLQIAPDLEPIFVMSPHDDATGAMITAARPPGYGLAAHVLSATPMLVMVLNGVIGGTIIAIVALRLAADASVVLLSAVAAFLVICATEVGYAGRSMVRTRAGIRPLFPTPSPDDRPQA
jgi:hypothetical protein